MTKKLPSGHKSSWKLQGKCGPNLEDHHPMTDGYVVKITTMVTAVPLGLLVPLPKMAFLWRFTTYIQVLGPDPPSSKLVF